SRPFGLWLLADGYGVHLKLAAQLSVDPADGRLELRLSDLPQLPLRGAELHFSDGPKAPFATPGECGVRPLESSFESWSGGPPLIAQATILTDSGCQRSGFTPRLQAGSLDNRAASSSPFLISLTRADGESALSAFKLTLPPGLLADLSTVTPCP